MDWIHVETPFTASGAGPSPSETVRQEPGNLGRTAWVAQVRRALSQLDDDSRDVLELSYFAQLTQPEIADSLGISLATVRRNAARGLRVLAHRLEAELGYLSLEAYSTGPR